MKLDWSKVEGYNENLTAEEKMALLEKHEFPDEPKPDGTNWKAQFDKAASELAAVKKQLRAKQSEEEVNEEARKAAQEALELELKELRREKAINGHKVSFMAQGYAEALAGEAAKAMADGDMDAVFAAMKKNAANQEKALRAQILKDTPRPPAGDSPEDTNEGVELAKNIGKSAATANKAVSDILSHYE